MRYRLSEHVGFVDWGEVSVISHGPLMRRVVVGKDLRVAIETLLEAMSVDEYTSQFADEDAGRGVFDYLLRNEFLVAEGLDETAQLAERLHLSRFASDSDDPFRAMSQSPQFSSLVALDPAAVALARGEQRTPLTIHLVGGCVFQVVTEALAQFGASRGFDVTVSYAWPGAARGEPPAELNVLNPWYRSTIEPLWDSFAELDPAQLEDRLARVRDGFDANFNAFVQSIDGRLGLIHGVTCPQVSPLGRFDYSFATIVHILNQHVAARCAAFRNLFFIDEERIVSCVGKTGVLDDLFATYSHHGNGWVSLARDGAWPTWVDLRRTRDYVGRLFDEYLAAYEVWRGDRALKCVVIDLDNTLWPGICGDEGFSWACAGFLLGGRFEGLHQVLRVLHSRGIMLATCSKNDETHVLADWRGRTNASVLSPDHCVLHRINWTRKSENIRDIASELNIGLDAILFVDDNPVERAEVAAALPQVQVYAGAMDDLRGYLLAEPRLHVRNQSREAGSRSDAVRAQLAHKRLREEASDDRSFLKNLGIRLQVRPAIADDTDRVVELVQRTNQFNTTLERITATELDALIASHNVWLLAVADRFVDYGVVGAIVIAEGAIRMLVMSCRVIALDPAVPFLVTVLRSTGLDRPGVIGDIVTGPRNSPARQIYLECGFKATDTVGRYALRDAADLPEVDRGIYGVLAMP